MANRWGNRGYSGWLFFWAPKSLQMVTAMHLQVQTRCLHLGRKAMTYLDSILKSRDFTLLTKVRLAKDMVFPVVMYRCSWGHKESDTSERPNWTELTDWNITKVGQHNYALQVNSKTTMASSCPSNQCLSLGILLIAPSFPLWSILNQSLQSCFI